MKILSIRIKNLASLSGEHFIDFETEPLASAGLVAIVGKTGAGKSTILDAMCLALFNKIPRLKDSDGKLQDVDGSELLTNSPLTVLRRGTAHGFAELRFVAQDQKHYLARWEIKRARENANGKLQSVQRYLKCETDGIVIADKAKAVDSAINKITQLSFEQFTRAVLLAQSEVTVFLKARDNERGELLEYLTNSNIFGKIGQLAYEKTKAITNQRKALENVLGHIEILSDEAAAELNQQFITVETEYKKLDIEKAHLAKQQLWFERKQDLNYEIVLKQQSYDTQLNIQQQLAPERQQLNRLEIFSSIRPVVSQQTQLITIERQLKPQIQQLQQSFDVVAKQFNLEKQNYQQAETALKTLQDFEIIHVDALKQVRSCIQERDFIGAEFNKLKTRCFELDAQQQPLIAQKQKIELEISKLTDQQEITQKQLSETINFNPLDQGIQAHIQQLQQFIIQYRNIENSLGDITQAQSKLTDDQFKLNQLNTAFGSIPQIEPQLTQLNTEREIKISQLNQFDLAKQKLKQYFELHTDLSKHQAKLQTFQTHSIELNQTSSQAEQAFETAKNERINLQQILQQQRLLHAENIEKLRENLVANEPCLVCGSLAHPYRDDVSQVSKAMFELQQQQEQRAILKEQQTFQLWQTAQQQTTKVQSELEQLTNTLKSNLGKLEIQQNELAQQFSNLQIQINFEQTSNQIERQVIESETQFQNDKQQVETQLKTLNQTIQQQNALVQQVQNIQYQLSHAKNLQQQIQHITACLSDTEQEQWAMQTTTYAKHVLTALSNRAQHLMSLDKLVKNLDLLNRNLSLIDVDQNNLTKLMAETMQARDDTYAKGQQNTQIATQLIHEITNLSEVKPHEWLIQHDAERQQKQHIYQQQKQSFEQLRIDFEKQQNELKQLLSRQIENQTSLDQTHIDIENWLNIHPEFTTHDLINLVQISTVQEQELRSKLQSSERLLNESASALKTLQEQQTAHLSHQPSIELSVLIQNVKDNLEALAAQSEVLDKLKVDLARHQDSLANQAKFSDQIQAIQQEEHRWGKISGLMGDANGKKFRDYAQQYNLDILLEHANQQLAMLSQRYTLKRLDHSLSLAIIDHDMDGEMRSVASLSGGESFLTALALSLAIANMASGSMKIESLFIDEGFGTLDASSLHMVMNALDQLQNQGRKVVLISHIQEMHERIPVQIQVKPLGAGASTIQIVS
ncbi:AAA family ATPase [Acinetobacter silvestris]|uniref:ATP-dependent dsDNA exonuclease n=1 Tax=Acinetobacter silvestris TaxID=1977882 RepID=A0A1Y3C9V7_9GAMM|nr:AAA family ATPase [Acinetobacter silvestris]OTG63490.1 ATP-dependent dsDNA exonuclease [Acinetobacter silvestris]